MADAGRVTDAGHVTDAGGVADGGALADAGSAPDAGGALDAGRTTTPTVAFTTPANLAIDVHLNAVISATFSEPMDPATLNTSSFTLINGAQAIQGVVSYANGTAVFRSAGPLSSNATYRGTISTSARSASGIALAGPHSWSFKTGNAGPVGLPVNLGTAVNFVLLAKSGVSTGGPASAITGDVGVSPAAATYITGFSLSADASNVFSRATQVTGQVFAANYADPTPANLTTAVGDMELALTDAAGRAPDVAELGAGDIGGMTLPSGVYKWGTGLLIPSDITLTGSATEVWIFQIAQNLTVTNGTRITLAGGAVAKNVFWQVSGAADFGTTAHVEGVVICQTAISLHTGASVNGRLLAQTAITLEGNTVVQPAR